MKVFISSDIEGTCGICDWSEAADEVKDPYFCRQMTREAGAAAKGAIDAGACEVLIKDAHSTARNIDPAGLPEKTKLLRGWTGDIYCMMSGIDSGKFDAAMMTGYHSPARGTGNPLSHTMHRSVESMKINGELCSEFMLNAYTAGYFGVPVCFVSGDKVLCEMAKELIPEIKTAAVLDGIGGATVSLHPDEAVRLIEAQSKAALSEEHYKKCLVTMPPLFEIQVSYQSHIAAYRNSFYPGAIQVGGTKLRYKSTNYIDVLRFVHFCTD